MVVSLSNVSDVVFFKFFLICSVVIMKLGVIVVFCFLFILLLFEEIGC